MQKYIYTKSIQTGRGGLQELTCISTELKNEQFESIYYFMGMPFYKVITDEDCCDDLVISKQILNHELLHTVMHCLLAHEIGLFE